jgi:hypothetical protein
MINGNLGEQESILLIPSIHFKDYYSTHHITLQATKNTCKFVFGRDMIHNN